MKSDFIFADPVEVSGPNPDNPIPFSPVCELFSFEGGILQRRLENNRLQKGCSKRNQNCPYNQ